MMRIIVPERVCSLYTVHSFRILIWNTDSQGAESGLCSANGCLRDGGFSDRYRLPGLPFWNLSVSI